MLRSGERFSSVEWSLSGTMESTSIDDEFDLDYIASELTGDDLKAYVFAIEHLKKRKQRKKHNKDGGVRAASVSIASHSEVPNSRSHQPSSQNLQQQQNDEKMSVAIDAFAAAKSRDANPATIAKYVSQCRMFLKIVAEPESDLMLSSLSAGNIRDYSKTLNKLPKKVSPSDPRSIEDILASSSSCLTDRTKSAHARAVTMFLVWCQGQLYSIESNLERPLSSVRKAPKPSIKRKHFLDAELKLVFESAIYQDGTFTRDSDYWVLLLGLFTGAREAELCQLDVSDIRRDPKTKIWIFDINDDGPDKRLKNAASIREVPIHPKLEELGFLEFAESARRTKQIKLFPAERRNKREEFDAFSKRFNRYLLKVRIVKDASVRLDFHSFRHTLQTDLLDQGHDEYIVNQLVGHSPAKSSHSVKTYSKGAGLAARREVLVKFRCSTILSNCQGTQIL
jgi:integrase